ncbi:F-box domain protein [Cooperia oncophora]
MTDSSHSFALVMAYSTPEGQFPWSRLPRELRVKILQNLCRSELDRCLLVNREMFELIRSHERLMKRRLLDKLVTREFKKSRTLKRKRMASIQDDGRYLSKVFRNANIRRLQLEEVSLTSDFLSPISSCLVHAGCRVQTLSISQTSTSNLANSSLFRFLRSIAPSGIELCQISESFREKVTLEILQFLVTRERFAVHDTGIVPIDDHILEHITASEFLISAPNLITVDGLKSFIESLEKRSMNAIHRMVSSILANRPVRRYRKAAGSSGSVFNVYRFGVPPFVRYLDQDTTCLWSSFLSLLLIPMPQKHSRTKNQVQEEGKKKDDKKNSGKIESHTSTMEAIDGLCDLPLSQSKDPFPWNCLPRELQLKILQYLDRSDLDVFRAFRPRRYEPIRRSNGPVVGQHHFTTFTSFLHYHLRKVLRNADISHLNIFSMPLTCEFLSTIISCIEDAGCRVNELTIEKTSTTGHLSDVLLRFFHTIAPVDISIEESYRSFLNTLTPEGLEFIVTRPSFSISALQLSSIIPIDDDVLANLTATRFWIDAPNMITSNGLKSFLQRVISGELTVRRGSISTHLHLYDVPFPAFTNSNMVIVLSRFDLGYVLNNIEIIPVEEAELRRI